MSINNDGGPAFPNSVPRWDGTGFPEGMSLRDWFAGQALAVLANADLRPGSDAEVAHLAMRLYRVADAMLVARHKSQP